MKLRFTSPLSATAHLMAAPMFHLEMGPLASPRILRLNLHPCAYHQRPFTVHIEVSAPIPTLRGSKREDYNSRVSCEIEIECEVIPETKNSRIYRERA